MVEEQDPDKSTAQKIQEQIAEEVERKNNDIPEPLNEEERGMTREETSLPQEETVERQSKERSPENGPIGGNYFDSVEDVTVEILGYHAGSENPDMLGEIVYEEANRGLVSVEYVLSENLVDTSGDVEMPVIDAYFSPEGGDILSFTYQREDVDVDIRRDKEGNYNVKAVYEDPGSVEEGVDEVAKFLAEFEQELTEAYRASFQETEDYDTEKWGTGRITKALQGEQPELSEPVETERRLRGD